MLWRCIKSDDSRKLVKIEGNFNSTKYIQLLKDNLIQDLEKGKNFQHDKAPCHSSHDEGITILKDCSAQNPDLNIIKQKWFCQKILWNLVELCQQE